MDKPAAAGNPRTETANVDIPFFITLRQPQKGHIQTGTVIKVELIILGHKCVGISGRAEQRTALRYTADSTVFDSQRKVIGNSFFTGYGRHIFGNSHAEVNDNIFFQHKRAATADDFFGAERKRFSTGIFRSASVTAESRIAFTAESLFMVSFIGNNDIVNINTGNCNEAGV